MIQNPILPGFHPDPSICRVGEDYYIATSTFEWYPGVQIYHSQHLRTWTLVGRPLDRAEQLDADSDVKPATIPIKYRPAFRYEAGHHSNQRPATFRH